MKYQNTFLNFLYVPIGNKVLCNLKKIITVLFSIFLIISSSNLLFAEETILHEINSDITAGYRYFHYDSIEEWYTSMRSDVVTPIYYIFAGNKDIVDSNRLLEDLNIIPNIREWAGSVYVINPLDGETYTDEDVLAFKRLVEKAATNVKVIGIDDGATFANNYLSQQCYFIAGMLLIGGDIHSGISTNVPFPVYLSDTKDEIITYYKKANKAENKEETNLSTIYFNEKERLQTVAIAKDNETLAQAFQNCWIAVFSKNFRYHNDVAEFYNLPVVDTEIVGVYTLVEVPIFEELNMIYNQMIDEEVTNMPGKYTWYEYIPTTMTTFKNNSTPLIVTLHGHQNDPRLQGDTSGWVELAAKENLMIVSPVWQDQDSNFFGCDGLGSKGIMELINDLCNKYPQIDRARIYLTGLSAGGSQATYMGIEYNTTFAGIASVAGVNIHAKEIEDLIGQYDGQEMPYLYICGDHDYFQMIPVDGSSPYGTSLLYGYSVWEEDDNVHIFSALQAYKKVNGIAISEMDMSLHPYYGMALEEERIELLGNKEMLVGNLSNNNGVIMELAAVKNLAHWNYKPQADYIWNFFKNYERDTLTGELVFVQEGDSTYILWIVFISLSILCMVVLYRKKLTTVRNK